MKYSDFIEKRTHGRADFPLEAYHPDADHPRYVMPLHWHPEMEIVRVREGHFDLRLNRNSYRLSPGDVAIINPGTLHSGEPHDCRYDCAVFKADMLCPDASSVVRQYLRPIASHREAIDEYLPLATHPRVCGLVEQMFSILEHPTEQYELAVFGALYQIMYECYRSGIVGVHTPGRALQKQLDQLTALLQWIDDHYTEHISLGRLSEVAGINEKYLCRFFKQYTQLTPIDYINHLRVERAAEDIRVRRASITEIAFSHGFNDSGYFCKIFRRVMGMSPSDYRRRAVGHGEEVQT